MGEGNKALKISWDQGEEQRIFQDKEFAIYPQGNGGTSKCVDSEVTSQSVFYNDSFLF